MQDCLKFGLVKVIRGGPAAGRFPPPGQLAQHLADGVEHDELGRLDGDGADFLGQAEPLEDPHHLVVQVSGPRERPVLLVLFQDEHIMAGLRKSQ